MISLKQRLRKDLDKQISDSKKHTTKLRSCLGSLDKVNTSKATYKVTLTSLWEDHGEKSVNRITIRKGLESSIREAELAYLTENNRGDVQATYFVEILIGREYYPVPEEYWKDFKLK